MKIVTLPALAAACFALSLTAASAAMPKTHHEATGSVAAAVAGDRTDGRAHLTTAERYVIVHNESHH